MNLEVIEVIKRSTQGSLNGTMSFPEVVGSLLSVGVSFYYVDLLRNEKTCYLSSGETQVEVLDLPLDGVSREFSGAEMAAAVKSSQTERQTFPVFVARARRAGCVGYFAYLEGRKVVYLGWLGEEHVEHFPS